VVRRNKNMKRNLIIITLGFLLGVILRDVLKIQIDSWLYFGLALSSGIVICAILSKIEKE
jgi:xanthine/uracil permease